MSESCSDHRIKFGYHDQMKRIEKERKRLSGILAKEPNSSFYHWMHEWLAKSDEEHFKNGESVQRCDMCGSIPSHIWSSDFSFCDEHSCSMDLCDECILKMAREVRRVKGTEEVVK